VIGAVQQAPVPSQKMQKSNGYSDGYAISSCTSKQNVKDVGGRLLNNILLMIYAFSVIKSDVKT
jgi:hypothetical protein